MARTAPDRDRDRDRIRFELILARLDDIAAAQRDVVALLQRAGVVGGDVPAVPGVSGSVSPVSVSGTPGNLGVTNIPGAADTSSAAGIPGTGGSAGRLRPESVVARPAVPPVEAAVPVVGPRRALDLPVDRLAQVVPSDPRVGSFWDGVHDRLVWPVVPVRFLHHLFNAWVEDDLGRLERGGLLGREVFDVLLARVIATEPHRVERWVWPADVLPLTFDVGALLGAAEPLVERYGLVRWQVPVRAVDRDDLRVVVVRRGDHARFFGPLP